MSGILQFIVAGSIPMFLFRPKCFLSANTKYLGGSITAITKWLYSTD
ncbi:MAG: hypothetical protein JXA41_13065 [Deltaproteobacteria bacterium]|nr:hypothetical protein [Deltaproteobacteria bacterium]